MDEKKIQRINELYKKKKNDTITEEELLEQAELRAEYIAAVRTNLRGTLENTSIQYPDGSVEQVSERRKH